MKRLKLIHLRLFAIMSLFFLFIGSSITSCLHHRFDENDPETFTQMPPRSEEGKGILAFLVDGKPCIHPAFFNSPPFPIRPGWRSEVVYDYLKDEDNYHLYSFRYEKLYNRSSAKLFIENIDRPPPFTTEAVFKYDKGQYHLFDDSIKSEVRATITRLDKEKKIIAGTFSGTIILAQGGKRVVHEIRNGFFDATYD